MKYAVYNESYFGSQYFAGGKYLQCGDEQAFFSNYPNETERDEKIWWCFTYCKECYVHPKQRVLLFTATTDFDQTDSFSLTIVIVPILTVSSVIGLYLLQYASLRYKSLRPYAILPVLQPVMEFLIVLCLSMYLFFIICS